MHDDQAEGYVDALAAELVDQAHDDEGLGELLAAVDLLLVEAVLAIAVGGRGRFPYRSR